MQYPNSKVKHTDHYMMQQVLSNKSYSNSEAMLSCVKLHFDEVSEL